MRILAIRGRNLASLARQFEVDLAHGELASAGLFAITGPVGAGKSTLLDALCLALFDRTPRLTGRGGTLIGDVGQDKGDWLRANDPRTLLRRNAVDGYAEVDFIGRDGVPYRSRWSVRRARRRADGRLQDQEMVLHDIQKDEVVATGRRSAVLLSIRQRLGLDFSQFCRSVLLAQGEFHAFLHAAAGDRAKLLETLTGAQIYRRLSRRAHEKRREQDQFVANLRSQFDGYEVLADEARKKLEADAEGHAKQVKVCELGIEVAQSYVLWHQDAERRRAEEGKAMAALQEAIAKNDAAKDRREQLQARQRAMAVVPRWEVAQEARAKGQRAAAAIASAKQQLAQAEQQVQHAQQQWRAALPESFGEPERVPALVRDLPQWLPSLQRWQDSETQLVRQREACKELRERAAASEKAVLTQREQVDVSDRRVAAAEAAVVEAETSVGETDYDQVSARRRELAARHASWLRASAALEQWRSAITVVEREQQALQRVRNEAAQAEPVRAQRDAVVHRCLDAVAKVRERVRLAEQHHGLETLRAQLEDGVACPLCGSEHHDVHGVAQPDLADARAELAQAEDALQKAQREAAQAVSEWQRLQGELAMRGEAARSADVACGKAQAGFVSAYDAGGDDVPAGELGVDAAGVRLEQQHDAWQVADRELAAIEKDAQRRSEAVRTARKVRSDAERQRAEARQVLEGAEKGHRQLADAAQAALAEGDRIAAVLEEVQRGLASACDGLPDGSAAVAVLAERRADVLQELHRLDAAAQQASNAQVDRAKAVADAVEQEQRVREEAAAAEQLLQVALQVHQVAEDDAAMAHRLGLDALRDEAEALKVLEDDVTRCRTELSLRTRLRREHEDHERPTLDAKDALRALEDAQQERARIEKLRLAVHAKIVLDDSMRSSRAQLLPTLERSERELEIWRALDDLIGSSAGDAFAVYAQGLTLDLLLLEANRRLQELARRYRLEKSRGGELDFVVVDLDMGGTRRSLHTLSGGETFLVSLALALALATLAAPRSRVETLFLDEGFGTLDAQNLEVALGALDSLQATGCQVGVISHVDGIAERIGAVVEVRPEGSGQSRVLARGC